MAKSKSRKNKAAQPQQKRSVSPPVNDSNDIVDATTETAVDTSTMDNDTITPIPYDITVAVGTYEGVLASWQCRADSSRFKIIFATPVHEGSIRSLSIAANNNKPGTLLSCGYDEIIKTHDFAKNCTSSGEIQTQHGTPVCSAFVNNTHALVGFANGSLVLYKKRDWTPCHVMNATVVESLAVHPTGKLALTGGESRIKCWDLLKGRLAYINKVSTRDPISCIVWNSDGTAYAWCTGNHVTVRDVATGRDLLDTDLPSRVNQICLFDSDDHLYLAAACNDGSLPVLAAYNDKSGTIRAIMAIEAAEENTERFKCIHCIKDTTLVVTANSLGVVSLWNLKGAVNILRSESENAKDDDEDEDDESSDGDSDVDSEDLEMAAEFVDGIQLGSGARITCMSVFAAAPTEQIDAVADSNNSITDNDDAVISEPDIENDKKRKNSEAVVERARELVKKAKVIQEKKNKKRKEKR